MQGETRPLTQGELCPVCGEALTYTHFCNSLSDPMREKELGGPSWRSNSVRPLDHTASHILSINRDHRP